jgi:hypothetical protein
MDQALGTCVFLRHTKCRTDAAAQQAGELGTTATIAVECHAMRQQAAASHQIIICRTEDKS